MGSLEWFIIGFVFGVYPGLLIAQWTARAYRRIIQSYRDMLEGGG